MELRDGKKVVGIRELYSKRQRAEGRRQKGRD